MTAGEMIICTKCNASITSIEAGPCALDDCPGHRVKLWRRVRAIVAEHLDVDFDKCNGDADLISLGADSLDSVELVMACEEEFSVVIDSDEGFTTIGDLATLCEKALGK